MPLTTPSPNERTSLVTPTASSGSTDAPTQDRLLRMEKGQPLIPPSNQSRKRIVEYDGDHHASVIFQLHGSVWPKVLPWCIVTLALTYFVFILKAQHIIDLTIGNTTGHTFMSLLVSFLVVTRTTITYNRFMEARQYLADLFRASRETVHYSCILTLTDPDYAAKQWRQDVAYRTMVTLRMVIAAIEYRSYGVNAWDTLNVEEHEVTELILPRRREPTSNTPHANNSKYQPVTDHAQFLQDMAHGPRTLADENFRAPIVWAYNLRQEILEPRRAQTFVNHPMHVNEELKILAQVSDMISAFSGLRKLITTPFPFPMVQMTRTFLFFWVFSLPLVLISDTSEAWEVMVTMFFCTYGFLGLEYVNMELDDPFGPDPNDFPLQSWAEMVYEDIYIAIYKTDGKRSATDLRARVMERITNGSTLDYRNDLRGQAASWTSSVALG